MPPLLDEIIRHKQSEVAEKKARLPLAQLELHVLPLIGHPFEKALQPTGTTDLRLILEIKPASPSAGVLADHVDLDKRLPIYNRYASALSVLTDERFFQGSLALLGQVLHQTPHPVLCKDFIVDPYQVLEARQAAAHAVLLIVKVLTDRELAVLFQLVVDLGMTPVVEVQTAEELNRALVLEPPVLLINNRNLETFEISLDTTRHLAPMIPQGCIVISASGIEGRPDIERLRPYASCFLIGSMLMKTPVDQLARQLQDLTGKNAYVD